jgi:putative membrane protein
MAIKGQRILWKGFLAGALGGLVGSFAMSQFHSLFPQKAESPPSQQAKEDSTARLASAISQNVFHHQLTARQKEIAQPAVHYAFGTSIAAMYGAAVEFNESFSIWLGMPFGAAVWLGAHVIAVPALGLSEPVTQSSPVQEAAEFSAHLVYGAVAEFVRRKSRMHLLRKLGSTG